MFDILVYGLSVAVCGMATVFLALIILIGLVKGLEKFTNGEVASLVKSKLADKLGAVAPQQPAKASSIPTLDDAELFAVITAAVAAVMEEEAKVVAAAAPTAEAAAQAVEEATETVIAAMKGDADGLASEAADLLYHLAVLLQSQGVEWRDVWEVLRKRHT